MSGPPMSDRHDTPSRQGPYGLVRAVGCREGSDFKTNRGSGLVLASPSSRRSNAPFNPREGMSMGFSGARAVLMIVALVVLVVLVTKFDLPGWIIPVGLIVAGVLVKERRA